MINKNQIYQIIEAETYVVTLENENLAVSGMRKCSEKIERYFNEDSKEKDSLIADLNFKLSCAQTNYNELKAMADEMDGQEWKPSDW